MRVRTAALIAAVAGAATACATGARIDAPGAGSDTGTPRTVAYETSPCFGTCPVYRLSVDTGTGAGEFEGKRFTAVTGTRAFTATPAQTLSFSAAVDEVRRLPANSFEQGGARCAIEATDHPSVTLTWSGGGAAPVTRHVYLGCRDEANTVLFERLRAAPNALPVADFIKPR